MSLIDVERPILFFDGVCNFCNGTINFIIRHDKKELFLFAPLQSQKGIEMLKALHPSTNESNSVILFYKGVYYEKSGAVLQLAKLIGGVWSLLLAAYILPRFIRDGVYDFVAKNRYKWFGKLDTCMVPSPGVRARFLS